MLFNLVTNMLATLIARAKSISSRAHKTPAKLRVYGTVLAFYGSEIRDVDQYPYSKP
jgi:hypothetical protein